MSFNSFHKPFTFCRIDFAPLGVSNERRIQTLATLTTFLLIVSSLISHIFAAWIIFFSSYWYPLMLYYVWIYYDREIAHKGGRKIRLAQKLKLWKYTAEYFPIKMLKTVDLPTTKNYLFVVYPHGVLSISSFINFCTDASDFDELFPGIDRYRITLDSNFYTPFTREFYLSLGGCASSERSIVNLLSRKDCTACVLVVGGAAESLNAYPNSYRITLNSRKGFIRLALQTGAAIVPVISFGENDIFRQIRAKWLRRCQDYFRNVTGISPVAILGRGIFQYSFGILPYRHPITTVVGKPIDMPKTEKPSKEMIQEYKNKFATELQTLFDENKTKYDHNGINAKLSIE